MINLNLITNSIQPQKNDLLLFPKEKLLPLQIIKMIVKCKMMKIKDELASLSCL